MNMIRLVVLLGVTSMGCDQKSSDTYVTARSSAGYQVRLKGELNEVPKKELESYVVLADILGREADGPFEVHLADRRDFAFRLEYPSEEWVRPNLLRFGPASGSGMPRRELRLTNESGASATRLLVKCEDMFLLFDLANETSAELPCRVSDWAVISGRLASGRVLPESLVRIPLSRNTVTIRITSSGFEVVRHVAGIARTLAVGG